jgi:hypothetical protein
MFGASLRWSFPEQGSIKQVLEKNYTEFLVYFQARLQYTIGYSKNRGRRVHQLVRPCVISGGYHE